jgi:hypothetical protein
MMVGSSQQQLLQRKGKAVADKGVPLPASAEMVVVAVKAATREISKTAIVWALTHVVQPGGSIIFLVVVSAHSSGNVLFLAFRMYFCQINLLLVSVFVFHVSHNTRLSVSMLHCID